MATSCELSSLRSLPADDVTDSHGTVDFSATRKRRFTVYYDGEFNRRRKHGVYETSPSPASHHCISLPVPPVLRGGDLETSISAYLTSEGVTPAEGQRTVARILSFLDGNAGQGFKVYAELEFITDEVVWMGDPVNYDVEAYRKLEAAGKLFISDPGACAICLDDLITDNGGRRLLLRCDHQFHRSCIVPWLRKSLTCPTCRRVLT